MIYLDNAATTFPKPKSVIHAVNQCLMNYSANPGRSGHSLSQKGALAVYDVRQKLCNYFHSNQPENVIFTSNCTQSINMVLKGILGYYDKVLISSLEHNAVLRPLTKLRQEKKIAVETFETAIGDTDQTFRSFLRTVTPDTKLVVCTHASNVCGAINPIERIGSYCKEHGILFCVDAAQSAGILPINMEEMNIDYLCVAPHKGLYAPMGTGILIINGPLPNTILEGGTGTESLQVLQPELPPERYESGTVNLPGIAGIGAGIDFIQNRPIYQHEMRLMKRIFEALKNMNGIRLYTGAMDENFAPVLSFNIIGLDSTQAAYKLDQMGMATRAGFHCAPTTHERLGTIDTGTVRVCPSVFTQQNDVERFISAVHSIAKKHIT